MLSTAVAEPLSSPIAKPNSRFSTAVTEAPNSTDASCAPTPDGVNEEFKYSKRRPVPINRNHDIEDDIPYSILVSGYNLDWNNPDFKWLRDEYMRLNKPIYDIKAEAREFVDGVEKLVQAGVTAIIQPSGSIRDKEIIKFANATETVLIFSKTRHFRH